MGPGKWQITAIGSPKKKQKFLIILQSVSSCSAGEASTGYQLLSSLRRAYRQ
jgi:hypothetical protein